MNRYLIIGNGVAGTTAAEQIRKLDKEGVITILTEEDLPFYYRIRLPELIAGELQEEKLVARKETWYSEQGIELRLKTRITGADLGKKTVFSDKGESFAFDLLLIATGSSSFVPPMKGAEKKGVFTLRSIQDARDIAGWARKIQNVVLIGGGLLGLEVGNGLRKLGKKVSVVEFFPRLLPRQLDVDGAARLQGIMEKMGFSFRLGARTREITGEDRVSGVSLEGGETLPCEMVVISAGVRPNLSLAKEINLDHDKGIKVDERLLTSSAGIYAAGDVAEFRGIPYGIWPAAMEQGKVAGINMAGGDAVYGGTTPANTLKVVGIDVASAGEIDAEGKFQSKIVSNGNLYKKAVLDQNRIIGCIMLGETGNFSKAVKAIGNKEDASKVIDSILGE
ncbi:MAG: NAD(P)/FAD-dependent oxidoreductase [Desulfobacteraceae bacterium]|nr:MAG: NAD(P)/FAD-dependent oxidoreductase [Desulfobacteraceae bacterium]